MSTTAQNLRVLRQRIRAHVSLPGPDERRRLRVAAGLPLADVAEAAGVTVAAVSAWERGTREPAGEAREAYARVLEVLREETAA